MEQGTNSEFFFLPFEADYISSIQLGHTVHKDCLLCHFSKEGHYTVKSGVCIVLGSFIIGFYYFPAALAKVIGLETPIRKL